MSDIDWLQYTDSLKREIEELKKYIMELESKILPLQDQLEFINQEFNIQNKLLNKSNDQRQKAINIADGIMQWDAPADARKSMKDLSDLKKEINDYE